MGFWDDLVDVGEDLYDGGKRLLGEVVDTTTDAAGDVLDAVGADGLADDVRDFGGGIADQLGATTAEKNLGESDDPKDLIHGDPGAMRGRAGELENLSKNFQSTGEGLRGISVGNFEGEAADAYHQTINEEVPKWLTAAASAGAASGALNALAPVVESAQTQAAEAIRLWNEAKQKEAEWESKRDAYDDAVDRKNAGADITLPPHPGENPGPGLRNHAVETLNRARESRNTAAATAAAAFKDAADDAPEKPPGGERLLANLGDLREVGNMFTGHMLVGLTGAVTDMGKLLRTVNPTDPYNVAHPAQYLANTSQVGAGLVNMAAHPDKLIEGIVGTGWGTDPGQATGALLANLIPMGPKGSGVMKSLLSDAVRGGERSAAHGVERSAAGAATPNSPAVAHGTPHDSPGAGLSDTRPHSDPTPAAQPHESAATPHDTSHQPEPRAEHPRTADPPSAERPPADHSPSPERHENPDQGALDHRSPDPQPHHESPAVDRTPDQHADSPSTHDRPSESPHRPDEPDTPRHDPDGRDPEPRQERTPDETPTPRDHTDGPAERPVPHDKTPDVDAPSEHPKPDADKPAERPTTERTEPARAPQDTAAPKPDGPHVADRPAEPARNDSAPANNNSPAPHTNTPNQPSPANPARADGPMPARDTPGPAPRDVPVARDAPAAKADIPASAKPSPASAADHTPRPVAAAAKEAAAAPADGARPIEAVAVVDRPGPAAVPEKAAPTKAGDHGGNGDGHKGTDDPHDPKDDGAFTNNEAADHAKNDPSASNEPGDTKVCGDPVDMATGEYTLPAVDVDLPAVLGLRLTRIHKSGYRAGVWLGPSWSCTFDSRVIVTTDSITTVDADGTMLSFDHPVADEPSTARTGRAWQLWNAPGGGYRLTPPHSGRSYHFAPKPHLRGSDIAAGVIFISAITDAHSNRILFTYNDSGAPSGVVHSGGYRVGVDCAGPRIRGYTLATDTTSHVLRRFGYTRGDLTTVTDAAGATTTFEYDAHHRMTAWIDSIGAHYANTYDERGRVVHQSGDNGVWSGSFTYSEDSNGRTSTYTDALGATTVFGFDADCVPARWPIRSAGSPAPISTPTATHWTSPIPPVQPPPCGTPPRACRPRSPTRSGRSPPSATPTPPPGPGRRGSPPPMVR